MPRIKHAHLSGRFDAVEREWNAALDYLAGEADVITLTEARGVTYLRRWATKHGWTVVQPKGAECAVLLRGGKVRAEGACPLTPHRLPSGKAVTATWARVDLHPRFRPVTFIVTHLPARVEARNGFQRGRETAVHADAVKGLRRLAAEQNRRVIICGDVNLNLRRGWVRAWSDRVFRRYVSSWRKLPAAGTFKGRIIDWHLAGRGITCSKARPLAPCAGFDHRPFVVTVEL
ncbi:hypothetical protein NOK12_16330 [Nocardioides sp. OK12]|uniref:endonuclease/exonuclease/phosphatase family protein n=1 Tax=Nocardioides sp. OK12 TaxID=2758661 RepID=UPI0021C4305C|nr:endonuclease/exonuclease/phosphatase family protein [Nocardioides sp. OK12]GHJ59115.1 hypothetical protein NOK12_16330 [Nocardioides sp. OK12]